MRCNVFDNDVEIVSPLLPSSYHHLSFVGRVVVHSNVAQGVSGSIPLSDIVGITGLFSLFENFSEVVGSLALCPV